jgi:hypothetical protein
MPSTNTNAATMMIAKKDADSCWANSSIIVLALRGAAFHKAGI